MRQLLSVVAGAAVAAVGGLIVGEYDQVGLVPLVAGVLFGLAVAEVVALVGDDLGPAVLAASSAEAGAGLAWGLWISTGRDLDYATTTAWLGVALGAVVAPLWLRSAARRGGRSRARS